jgi:hypothetical protein
VKFFKMSLVFKNTLSRIFYSVFTWGLVKHTCGSLRNNIILLSLDFMPSNQIGHMSLNGMRSHVTTINTTQTGTHKHETLVSLVPEDQVSSIGALMLSFHQPKNNFLEYLQH